MGGLKNTLEWPMVVSGDFPQVLGDTLNRKVFSNLFLVIGSAVSEISQFVHFYVKARESQYLGNSSSNHQKSIPKKLYTKYPYNPRKNPDLAVLDSVSAHTNLLDYFKRPGSFR